MTVEELTKEVDDKALMDRSFTKWKQVLAEDCGVYVFGEQYLVKRFDQINYKFCGKEEAKEVLIDNVYSLLRYKYFKKQSDEIDDKISKILNNFTVNLKGSIKKVTFDKHDGCFLVSLLPDYCVAFRNGVYNFKDDKWFFKYDIKYIKHLGNYIYEYDRDYVIQWYFNFDFEPLNELNIMNMDINNIIDLMKILTQEQRNYCFELMYNISHDSLNRFDIGRFEHLCQILGYSLLPSFAQYFVMLIGSGQNGKNSLFDGCFTNRVQPMPTSNSMEEIEQDKFITGTLAGKCHNIFLETSAKTIKESTMIKALTGSMYQTIQNKGDNKYSGIINCKYIFAGNDRDKIKFSDDTVGFIRRINLYEIYYQWDKNKEFLTLGDYYDTTFSNSLKELKDDISNTIIYIYLGMYGLKIGTNDFNEGFKFTYNDWKKDSYSDLDKELKKSIEDITINTLCRFVISNKNDKDIKASLLDQHGIVLRKSPDIYCNASWDSYINFLSDKSEDKEDIRRAFFNDYDFYIGVRDLQKLLDYPGNSTSFTQNIKKIYSLKNYVVTYQNRPYIKFKFQDDKMLILKNQNPEPLPKNLKLNSILGDNPEDDNE